ncbi:MAG: trypsin-like peptidase domain-containing protein [Armatimonadetes bacterium]|nr:trypsin-like peptidase domain-containing protein [Armatimonadota bacterium]
MSEPRKDFTYGLVVAALVVGLLGGVLGGYLAATRAVAHVQPPGAVVPQTAPQVGGTLKVLSQSDAVVAAVKRVTPSVVKVETLNAPSMEDLFRQWMGGMVPGEPVAGVGSGFIFEYGGRHFVMTNTHVVGNALQCKLKLTDGRRYDADLLGADPNRDLAVMQIINPPADLVPASLGDSDRLEVGETVIAMGNPFDYENTVTVGVVSAKGYRPVGEGQSRKVIQTDAAINMGNSGGPLVDLGGNVVGINYKIFSPNQLYVGIGFAIPINEAKMTARVLIEGGPWIGLGDLLPNSRGLAAHFGLPTDKGVVVLSVAPGGPAERAGVLPGDIITAVDDRPVADAQQVAEAVLSHHIGDTIVLQVHRGSQQLLIRVRAGKIPGNYRPGTT